MMEKVEINLCGDDWKRRLDIEKSVYEGFFKPNLTQDELALIRKQKRNPTNSSFGIHLPVSDKQTNRKYKFELHFEQVNRCRSSYTYVLIGDWSIYSQTREAEMGDVVTFSWSHDDHGSRILSVSLHKKKVDEGPNLNFCFSECKENASLSKSGDEELNINEWSTDDLMAAETLLMLSNGQANICVPGCKEDTSFSHTGDEELNINEWSTDDLMAAETLLLLRNDQANVESKSVTEGKREMDI